MNVCSQLKEQARENLLGNYKNLVSASFLYAVILSILLSAFSNVLVTNLSGEMNLSRVVAGIAGIVIVLMIAGLLRSSLGACQIKIARQEENDSFDLLFPLKNHPDRFMGLALIHVAIAAVCMLPGIVITFLAVRIWMIALIILGIAVEVLGIVLMISLFLSWALARFLLLDDPYGRTVFSALRESADDMKGERKFLFKMIVSFIGWLFLGLATFALGYLWIGPYFGQSLAIFYANIVPAE